ncbi:hypothetical protein NLG97_g8416 [Lecanicillium saksenae]|uniref:Uncharacterized protein n=1 Tax=Lecanicillium saksenae TaxID=468837 RepID=A0ACC1QKR3_9HYPO|nr:hypothetical protein NLG97_g8416 [Lecanicillium saksenae]
MKTAVAFAVLQALAVQGIRIVQGNDDGWAELYARSFHDALRASGHDAVLSCPAENKSGSSSRDEKPTDRKDACEYDSCPPNSGPAGHNATRPELNWVNSFPVTAIKYGIDTFGPQLWDGAAPELAVSGPNVGTNIWLAVPFSGTVGAAAYARTPRASPALAFSGADHGRILAISAQKKAAKKCNWNMMRRIRQRGGPVSELLHDALIRDDAGWFIGGPVYNVRKMLTCSKCRHGRNAIIFGIRDIDARSSAAFSAVAPRRNGLRRAEGTKKLRIKCDAFASTFVLE